MEVGVIWSKDSEMGAGNSASKTEYNFYLMICGISFHGVGLNSMSDTYKWQTMDINLIFLNLNFLICKLREIPFLILKILMAGRAEALIPQKDAGYSTGQVTGALAGASRPSHLLDLGVLRGVLMGWLGREGQDSREVATSYL